LAKFTATILLLALIGPLIGGASHAVLLVLLEPRALIEETPAFVLSLVALSYGMGLAPALIVGAAVAWRRRRGSRTTPPFALAVAVLAPVVLAVLIAVVWDVGSGLPLLDEDTIWRERQLQDILGIVLPVILHSVTAAIGCWLLARRLHLL